MGFFGPCSYQIELEPEMGAGHDFNKLVINIESEYDHYNLTCTTYRTEKSKEEQFSTGIKYELSETMKIPRGMLNNPSEKKALVSEIREFCGAQDGIPLDLRVKKDGSSTSYDGPKLTNHIISEAEKLGDKPLITPRKVGYTAALLAAFGFGLAADGIIDGKDVNSTTNDLNKVIYLLKQYDDYFDANTKKFFWNEIKAAGIPELSDEELFNAGIDLRKEQLNNYPFMFQGYETELDGLREAKKQLKDAEKN